MTKSVYAAVAPLALFAVILTLVGCNSGTTNPAGGPGPGPGGPQSPIKQIMKRVSGGPQSLHTQLGKELNADAPAWDTIQPQTKEYAESAASLAKNDPPKGSKESWQNLCASYAESAAALDKAAQGKDVGGAKAAHQKLNESCMACHKEHRGGRG